MTVIDRKAPWMLELDWLVAFHTELGHERAILIIIIREYLHSIIVAINNEQETSMMVERQASREVEQAISIALLAGADREQLDSRSIAINRIVSHPLPRHSISLPRQQWRRRETLEASNQEMTLTRLEQPREIPTQPSNKTMNEGTKNSTTPKHPTLTQEPLALDTALRLHICVCTV